MNRKQIKNIENKLEEQMSNTEWFIWIAAGFSSCNSLTEYLRNAYQCPNLEMSDFYRPQIVCERLAAKNETNYEINRRNAYEYRLRVQLAMAINSYLDEYFSGWTKRFLLNKTQHELILARLELLHRGFYTNSDDIEFGLRFDQSGLYGQYNEFEIPTLIAFCEAVSLIQSEYYEDHPFLTVENQKSINSCLEISKAFLNSVGEGLEDTEPIPEEFYLKRISKFRDRFYEKWLQEARANARAYVFGDDSMQIDFCRQSLIENHEIPMYGE